MSSVIHTSNKRKMMNAFFLLSFCFWNYQAKIISFRFSLFTNLYYRYFVRLCLPINNNKCKWVNKLHKIMKKKKKHRIHEWMHSLMMQVGNYLIYALLSTNKLWIYFLLMPNAFRKKMKNNLNFELRFEQKMNCLWPC